MRWGKKQFSSFQFSYIATEDYNLKSPEYNSSDQAGVLLTLRAGSEPATENIFPGPTGCWTSSLGQNPEV